VLIPGLALIVNRGAQAILVLDGHVAGPAQCIVVIHPPQAAASRLRHAFFGQGTQTLGGGVVMPIGLVSGCPGTAGIVMVGTFQMLPR